MRAQLHRCDAKVLTAEEWRRLGDDVDVRLAEAATDTKRLVAARARALAGLGALGGEHARRTIVALLDAEATPAELVAASFAAYARAFPTAADLRARAERLADDPDPLVRRAVDRALANSGESWAPSVRVRARAVDAVEAPEAP